MTKTSFWKHYVKQMNLRFFFKVQLWYLANIIVLRRTKTGSNGLRYLNVKSLISSCVCAIKIIEYLALLFLAPLNGTRHDNISRRPFKKLFFMF